MSAALLSDMSASSPLVAFLVGSLELFADENGSLRGSLKQIRCHPMVCLWLSVNKVFDKRDVTVIYILRVICRESLADI